MKSTFTQINGTAVLFKKTIKTNRGAFDAYNVTVSKKKEDGSYANAYLDCKLSKAALESGAGIVWTKAKNDSEWAHVNITGWLTVKAGDERNYVALFINELNGVDEELPL